MYGVAHGKQILIDVILLLISCSCYGCFNLDTRFAIVYNGSKGSYFGYTTALHRNKWGPLALVGAPRANTTTFRDRVYQPGTLFRCNVTKNRTPEECQEILLMTEGAKEISHRYNLLYEDNKNTMWLGVSLDVRPSLKENDIVTCGHLWKNQYRPRIYFVNGVCYVISGNLEQNSVRKLLPLTETDMQYGRDSEGALEYNHMHGQAGISAAFSENGSNLILGAPGIWSWTGSYVNYRMNSGLSRNNYANPVIPPPPYEIEYNSYFGYSVTTGRFFELWTEFYAAGAPRDGENYGKVYIFEQLRNGMRIRQRKQGVQLGEYFGASVLGVNLNGDSYTDLLVGAPFNSLDSAGDEGKVYVYISNGMDLQTPIELTGDKKPSARFGTALANIGDLNQDRYTDIAIGAPYEDDHGTVYIYHGSSSGVKSRYAQKIEASAIHSKLSGFGIHISRGLDIDDNGYPDILVGSYASSNAVLLRSRPVIRAFHQLTFIPKQITMNQTICEVGGQNLTCVQVNACLWYSGTHVPASLEFQLTVSVQDPSSRGFQFQNTRRTFSSMLDEVLNINQKTCSRFEVYLNPDIEDVITPIPVRFSHKLAIPRRSGHLFDESFPVYHPSSPTNITSYITFHTGCGKEDECYSDLIVTATRTEPAEGGVITLGKISRVEIVITVKNVGEPAYLSELLINLPPEMPSIKDSCEAGNQQKNASLVCNLGNPLSNGTEVTINIKLDAEKIPPHTKYLEIVCRGITLSTEMNPDDNVETVPLHLKTVSDIGITGVPSHDQIMYDGTTRNATPIITHNYTVINHGPSPLQTIDILLYVPYLFSTSSGQKPFLSFTGLQVDGGMRQRIPAVCEDSSLSIKKVQPTFKNRGKTTVKIDEIMHDINGNNSNVFDSNHSIESPSDLTANSDVQPTVLQPEKQNEGNKRASSKVGGHIVINCERSDVGCVELRCSASPFTNLRKFAQISVDFQLNFAVLEDHLGPWYQIEFITTGFISVTDSSVIQLHQHPEVAHIKTSLLHEGPPPQEELASWIIFVSVGVGVILLLLILILLIKIGFFRRKEKDKMKKMLKDSKTEETNIQQDTHDSKVLTE